MKTMIHKIVALLVAITTVCSISVCVYAAGSVTYLGNAEKFIFAPGSAYSPTDLFESFKGVMPGDTLTEQIQIRNDVSENVKIKVYMRSLGAQEDTDAFLSQLNLSVVQDGDSVLFAAPADQTAQLTDWVYLGTVYSGGEITLDVTLEVPITMGKEWEHKIGYIDWQFKVEELPVEPDDPMPPQTGDDSPIALFGAFTVISLVALILLVVIKHKKREQPV